MSTGYEIIEPPPLASLLATLRHASFSVALLTWLAREVQTELGQKLSGARLEVIPVFSHGGSGFPALGLNHAQKDSELGPLVEATIERLLSERPVLELAHFIAASETSWLEEASRLLHG
jgi:hypothetical protein